jgi:ParB/RepB/Spo0J family partition protein
MAVAKILFECAEERILIMKKTNTEMIFKLDPKKLLKDTKFQTRPFDKENIVGLVEQIKRNGQGQPVIVRPTPNGKGHQLVAGWNRTEACRLAGVQVIARIMDIDDKRAMDLAVTENTYRKSLTGFQRFQLLKRLRKSKFTASETARALNVGRERISEISRIGNYPQLIEQLKIENGGLSLEACATIAKALSPAKIDPRNTDVIGRVISTIKITGGATVLDTVKAVIEQSNNRANVNLNRSIKPKSAEKIGLLLSRVVIAYRRNPTKPNFKNFTMDQLKEAKTEAESLVSVIDSVINAAKPIPAALAAKPAKAETIK